MVKKIDQHSVVHVQNSSLQRIAQHTHTNHKFQLQIQESLNLLELQSEDAKME